jgi:hypothetical protein
MSRPDDKTPMSNSDESEHDKLVKAARHAIQAVANDCNVTLEHSIMSLRSLKLHIDNRLDVLERGV